MLIPLTTDRPQRRFPLVTWALLIINAIVFVGLSGIEKTDPERFERLQRRAWLNPLNLGLGGADGRLLRESPSPLPLLGPGEVLTPQELNDRAMRHVKALISAGGYREQSSENWGWWTLVTYQFLHGGFMHLIGNMIFLWVFGPAIEDRFGRVGFLLFYLVGGVLAGLSHAVFEAAPVVGASGSIAAVTGAFLVLFPRTHIKLFFFWLTIGVFELPAWIFLLLAVAKDIWGVGMGGGGVAFLAHLGGYAMGVGVSMILLGTRILPDEDWSLLAVFRQQRRRAEFRRLASEADREWKGRIEKRVGAKDEPPAARPASPSTAGGMKDEAKPVEERPRHPGRGVEERVLWQRMDAKDAAEQSDKENARLAGVRAALAEKVAAEDAAGASAAFRSLMKEERGPGNRRVLVEAGNLFAADARYADAADAYEAFLASLKGQSDPEEGRVRLMLALVTHRYLKDPKRAGAALAGIKSPFNDPELHVLADSLRDALRVARPG